MRKLMLWGFLLAVVGAVSGCGSGYPSTERRIEEVDETIRSKNLPGEPNETRDKRFETNVNTRRD
ncbi:MAG: hypothetical protein HYY18_02780 [Planctomycetes bacterium]|nr:hypothetical protein [Planctomycetota bacterium]